MKNNYHLTPVIKAIAISSSVLVLLACSPSQQPEQQSESKQEPASTMHASDSAPFAVHTPEMWEVKIARLVAEGNIDEADAELEKLQQEFPDYQINPILLENMNQYHD
jgi:hypothetical protein